MLVDSVWNDVLSFDNIDDSVECFTTVLQGLLDPLLPLRRIRIKQHTNCWVATNIIIDLEFLLQDSTVMNFTIVLFLLVFLQTGNYSAKLITKLIICFKYAMSQYLTDLFESSKGSSMSHFCYLSTKGIKSNHNNIIIRLLQMILTIIFCQCHTTLLFSL